MTPLSSQQSKVYTYLKSRFYSSGSMPTLRELCSEMGWNAVGTAQTVIQALVEKGFLKRDPQKSRGLQIVDVTGGRAVPILGSAPAGSPLEAFEHHEGDLLLPSFIRGPVFAVRVKGDSMIEADIQDGDLAIVKETPNAENHEIVVAMLAGEVTIKRFLIKGEEMWLKPENAKYRARKIMDPSFKILGRVIGLHRYFER